MGSPWWANGFQCLWLSVVPFFCAVLGGWNETQTFPGFSGAQGHRQLVLAEQPGQALQIALQHCVPCWSSPAPQPSSALLAARPQPRRARSAPPSAPRHISLDVKPHLLAQTHPLELLSTTQLEGCQQHGHHSSCSF